MTALSSWQGRLVAAGDLLEGNPHQILKLSTLIQFSRRALQVYEIFFWCRKIRRINIVVDGIMYILKK